MSEYFETSIRHFDFEERIGQLFTVQAGVLSLLASTFILCFAFVRWFQQWRNPKAATYAATDSNLFLNLMLTDMIQALGVLPNIRWLADGTIVNGNLCRSQGVLKHVGMVGVAFSSLSIAVYTYVVLVMRHIPSRNASKYVVLAVWVATAFITGIPNVVHHSRNEPFYGPVGFWCWIRYEWRTEQLTTMYLWLWICAIAMLVLYFLIFCHIRGWIKTTRSGHFHETNTTKSSNSSTDEQYEYNRKTKAVARLMLYFPGVYIITILPNSIARWLEFSGHRPPSAITLFANTVFALSGFLSLVLFMITRPRMVIGERVNISRSNTGFANGTGSSRLSRIGTPRPLSLQSNSNLKSRPHSMKPPSIHVHVHSIRNTDSGPLTSGEVYQVKEENELDEFVPIKEGHTGAL